MAQKKVFCNVCGHESEIDAGKEFFFCPECGNKVAVKKTIPQTVTLNTETDTVKDTVTERLKEVKFYYQLSFDKKEYKKTESDPTYYLKAQDLLVDLSTQFPDDYRIWLRVFGISGSLFINSIPLKQDKEYIKRLSATSKKPIITLSKVFS